MKMKFNNGPTVQDSLKKRNFYQQKVCLLQAGRGQSLAGCDAPQKISRGLQSLASSTWKVQAKDQLPRENEKHNDFNGKYKEIYVSSSYQEPENGPAVQSSTKRRRLDLFCHSASGGGPSNMHPIELENENKRKLARGKAVVAQMAVPTFEEIKRDHLPRNEASQVYSIKALIRDRSKSSKFQKVNKIAEVHSQHMIGRTLEINAAENSCSSVSSSESCTPHNFTSFDKYGLSRPLSDVNVGNLEPCSLYKSLKDNRLTSGEKQANEVHKLESLAYRSVLNALRARGPLNWQQEILLTDLRLSLHISNDEHRIELTQMCSAQGV
eukprot:Gb_02304 [translate_table: standard]